MLENSLLLICLRYFLLATGITYLIFSSISIGRLIGSDDFSVSFFLGEIVLSLISIICSLLFQYPFNLIFILILTIYPFGKEFLKWLRNIPKKIKYKFNPTHILVIVLSFLLAINLLRALQPPFTWDDVSYHTPAVIEISKGFVKFPLFKNSPYLFYQTFFSKFYGNLPFGQESYASVLYLLSFGYGSAAGLVAFLNFIFFLLFLNNYLKYKLKSGLSARITIFIFLITCVDIIGILSTGYVDISVAIFQFLGIIYLWEFLRKSKLENVIFSVAFISFTFSLKYTSLYILPAYIPFLLISIISKQKNKHLFKTFSLVFLTGVLAGGFWYIKNFLLYKNPVYPFIFGHLGVSDSDYRTLMYQIYSPAKESIIQILDSTFRGQPLLLISLCIILFMYLRKNIKLWSLESVLLVFSLCLYIENYFFGSQINRFVILLPVCILIIMVGFLEKYKLSIVFFGLLSLLLIRLNPMQWSIWVAITKSSYHFIDGNEAALYLQNIGCVDGIVSFAESNKIEGKIINFWDPYSAIFYKGKMIFYYFDNLDYQNFNLPSNVNYLYLNTLLRDSFVDNQEFHRDIDPLSRAKLEERLLKGAKVLYDMEGCRLYALKRT